MVGDFVRGKPQEPDALALALGFSALLGVATLLFFGALLVWQLERQTKSATETVFLEFFALTVALGLRHLGVLLMGPLIIIPAATAKRMTRTLRGMLGFAVGASVFSRVVGTIVAGVINRPTGPVSISVAALLFLLSLLRPRR